MKLERRLERGASVCASSHTNEPDEAAPGSSHTHASPPRSAMKAAAFGEVTIFTAAIEPRERAGRTRRPAPYPSGRLDHRDVLAGGTTGSHGFFFWAIQ